MCLIGCRIFQFHAVCVSYRHVVDPHAADGSAIIAEVVLDGRVRHLEPSEEEHEEVFRSFR